MFERILRLLLILFEFFSLLLKVLDDIYKLTKVKALLGHIGSKFHGLLVDGMSLIEGRLFVEVFFEHLVQGFGAFYPGPLLLNMFNALKKFFLLGGCAFELFCRFRDPLFILTEHLLQVMDGHVAFLMEF